MTQKKFPTYNPQRRTGDRGVTFVKAIVENHFEWIFRPVHLEEDFGLDGYFDIIGSDNSVTGKYLGVQIKTGDSYFANETSFGWRYAGENKHLNYFLNLNFPVLIILVDLKNQKAFWVEFDVNKTDRIKNGWSIIVPKANLLNPQAKSEISKLAGEVIDYMSQLEYQWELNKKIKESPLTILNVNKEEIVAKDVSGFIELLKRLTINDEMIKSARGKLTFLIDGYNDDIREIYEIPEVREWTKLVIPAFKYWGYFINMESGIKKIAGLRFLHFCFVDVTINHSKGKSGTKSISFDIQQTVDFMSQLFDWLNEFCDKYPVAEEFNRVQSELIANVLFERPLKK